MKTLIIFFLLIHGAYMYSQAPGSFKYQAVIRNSAGEVITNQDVGIKISILGKAGTLPEYTETHSVKTNDYGLINLNVGEGITSDDFTTIEWSEGEYFISIEIDVTGGSEYVLMGTSQLLSVPFALYAEQAGSVENIDDADADPGNELQTLSISNDTIYLTDGSFVKLPAQAPAFSGSFFDLIDVPENLDTTTLDDFDGKYGSLTETPDLSDTALYLKSGEQTLEDILALNNNAHYQIKNLKDPTDDQDAATKVYVDELETKFKQMERILKNLGVYVLEDIDHNVYEIAKIGNQVWMAENLKVTHYSDGTPIPLITSNAEWENLGDNNTDDAYCFYDFDENSKYGALYTWAAVMNGAGSSDSNPGGVQGVCPDGWHLPSDDEWKELEMYIGISYTVVDDSGGRGTVGYKLRSRNGWGGGGLGGGTDEFGFSALPGGRNQKFKLYFTGAHSDGYWWSGTEYNSTSVWIRQLSDIGREVYRNACPKSFGISVRCVKDDTSCN